MRWQDYGQHFGGVTGFIKASDRLYFDGGFMSPGLGLRPLWSFAVNRLTGAGTLHEEGKPDVGYTCGKAAPRF